MSASGTWKLRYPGRKWDVGEDTWDTLKKEWSEILSGRMRNITFQSAYQKTYRIILDGQSKFLIKSFHELVREHLQVAMQQLDNRVDEEYLIFFSTLSDTYTKSIGMLQDVFAYLDRFENARSDIIQRMVWDEYFYPRMQHQLRYTTWKMHMVSPQASVLQHKLVHEVARNHRMPTSLDSLSGRGLYSIYLATCPLRTRTSLAGTWTAGCHWGLVIVSENETQWLHEITKTGPGQLVGIPEPERFEHQKGRQWSLMAGIPVGYTFLSPYSIHHRYAKELRKAYKLLSDNCQTFCERLLECIRIPLHPTDVFHGLDWAPATISQIIISRRCKDYEKLAVLRQLELVGPTASLPISIQAMFLDSLVVLIEIFAYMRSAALAALLLTAIITYFQHGNVPLFNRLIRRAIRPDADMLRLIYSEIYPRETPEIGVSEQKNEEIPVMSVADVSDEVESRPIGSDAAKLPSAL